MRGFCGIGLGVGRALRERQIAVLVALLALVALGGFGSAPAAQAAEEPCTAASGNPALVAWGANGTGNLGAGFKSGDENFPNPVLNLTGVKEVQAGFHMLLALMGNSTVCSWGTNEHGMLGDGILHKSESQPVPVLEKLEPGPSAAARELTNVKELTAARSAQSHPEALKNDGTVWTWGASEFGERGTGESNYEAIAAQNKEFYEPRYIATKVPGLANIVQVAAGGDRDYALTRKEVVEGKEVGGEVWGWGEDAEGELGVHAGAEDKECHGEPLPTVRRKCVLKPLKVKEEPNSGEWVNLHGVEKIAAGSGAAYAVVHQGKELFGWGSNVAGQLGIVGESTPLTDHALKVFEAPTGETIREVSAGSRDVFVRLSGGAVYAWGANGAGQLGFETTTEQPRCGLCVPTPVPVTSLSNVVSIAAGEANTLAIKEDREGHRGVYSFGLNGHFEVLGLGPAIEGNKTPTGAYVYTATPTQIGGLGEIAEVSAGFGISAAVIAGGTVPPSAVSATALPEQLTISTPALAEAYELRYRPRGASEEALKWFPSAAEKVQACKEEAGKTPPCAKSFTLEHLVPEPYEFSLLAGHFEGKVFARSHTRKVIATPQSNPSAPQNTRAPILYAAGVEDAAHRGIGQEGGTLTVAPGAWTTELTNTTYEWLRCEGYGDAGTPEKFGENCNTIKTESLKAREAPKPYALTSEDVAKTILVRERVSNSAGPNVKFSEPALVLGGEPDEQNLTEVGPPLATTSPSLEGAPEEGNELKVQTGTWEPEPFPNKFTIKWFRCRTESKPQVLESTEEEEEVLGGCTSTGVSGPNYSPGPADVGYYMKVLVKAENSGGSNVAAIGESTAVESKLPPALFEKEGKTYPPSISGLIEVDQGAVAHTGLWGNHTTTEKMWVEVCSKTTCEPVKKEGWDQIVEKNGKKEVVKREFLEWQFKQAEAAEEERSTNTFLVPNKPEDFLKVRVVASNAHGQTEATATTAEIPAGPNAPEHVKGSVPVFEGTPRQGETLKYVEGARWQNWDAETDWKYAHMTPPLAAYAITKEYQFKRCNSENKCEEAGTSVSYSCKFEPSAEGYEGFKPEGEARKSPETGNKLIENPVGKAPVDCSLPEGGSPLAYKLTYEDVGDTMQLIETLKVPGHGLIERSEKSTVVTGFKPVDQTRPTVTGEVRQGQTLTGHHGTWEWGVTGYTVTWKRCNAQGESCVAVTSPTPLKPQEAAHYTIQAVDAKEKGTIVLEERAENHAGVAEAAATSLPTEVVKPAKPGPLTAPHIEVPGGGQPILGKPVVLVAGTWTNEPTTREVEWMRCEGTQCKVVATHAPASENDSYTPVAEDLSKTLEAREVVSNGAASWATTEATAPVIKAPPVVKAVKPAKGRVAGGEAVTITGENLDGATAVEFGFELAMHFEVKSSTEIVATAPPGSGIVDVRVITPSGPSETSELDRYTYVPPPSITSVEPARGPTAGGTRVTIAGANLAEAISVKFGGVAATIVESTTSTITVTSPAGSGTVDVNVETPYGKSTEGQATDKYSYVPPPSISAVEPAKGKTAGGTNVTISGANFGEAMAVKFGGTAATIVSSTQSTIVVTAPAGTGTVDVIVETPYGKSIEGQSTDKYTYVGPPSITKLEPNQGPLAAGAAVTIVGENLAEATSVRFGTATATIVESTASSIKVNAPGATAAGTVEVVVETPYGTSGKVAADQYTYVLAPTVTRVAPVSGSAAGGESITVTGTNLTGTTRVRFGTLIVEGSCVKVKSATSVVVCTPPRVGGVVDVVVITPGGESAITTKDHYTFLPVIVSLSPTRGLPAGGTTVTIHGAGFAVGKAGTTFKFGSSAATEVNCPSGSECTAVSPVHKLKLGATEESVDVIATVNEAKSAKTAADQFTYALTP